MRFGRHKRTMIQLITLLALCATATLGAPSYCAFEVNIRNASGSPSANAPVEMVSGGRHLAVAMTNKQGLARFCDAPLQGVDFAVGVRDCGVVLVKGVKLTWPETREVFITYDNGHCSGELIFPNSCQLLLRVHDEEGRPLEGAEIDSGPSTPSVSDDFGRIFLLVKSGENLEGVLKMEGREPVRISEHCVRDDERDFEKSVVLKKAGR